VPVTGDVDFTRMKRYLALFVLVAAAVAAATIWVMAGRAPGPRIEIVKPTAIGEVGELVVNIDTPGGEITRLEVLLRQEGSTMTVFLLTREGMSKLEREGDNRVVLRQSIGRQRFDGLKEGPASIDILAVRPVLFGRREVTTQARFGIEVRLRPPTIDVQSQFHYINHGGSEFVVYHVTPGDAASGVITPMDRNRVCISRAGCARADCHLSAKAGIILVMADAHGGRCG
jgi:hypothetical protein